MESRLLLWLRPRNRSEANPASRWIPLCRPTLPTCSRRSGRSSTGRARILSYHLLSSRLHAGEERLGEFAESRLVRRPFRWNVLLHDMLFSAEFVPVILHEVSGFSSSGFGAGLWRGKPSCRREGSGRWPPWRLSPLSPSRDGRAARMGGRSVARRPRCFASPGRKKPLLHLVRQLAHGRSFDQA